MSQVVTAKLSYLRQSPRKVRLVADMIRGRKVTTALNFLSLLPKKAARPLYKLLASAVANAKHNHKLEVDVLKVLSITVDGGPVLKRYMPKAHGSATPIRERTSHIKLVLAELPKKEEKKKKTK